MNLIPEKNSKNKIFKLQQPKKFNSLKSEKTPEKSIIITNNLDKNTVNLKFRTSTTSLLNQNSIPLNTNIANSNQNTYNINYKKKQISPKVEMSILSNKSDPKKSNFLINTTSATEKSELQTISDNNFTSINANAHPNYLYSHYNKSISNIKNSMFYNYSHNETINNNKTSFSNDYSMKIIDLLDKMRNFLSITCQEPSLLINHDNKSKENFATLSTNFDGLFPSANKHLKKNLSEDFDLLSNKLSLEYMNINGLHSQNQKINLIFKEIEGIYNGSINLNESVKSTMFSTIENNNETFIFESTKQNINQINSSSERMVLTYKKLFDICGECLKGIKAMILESFDSAETNKNNNIQDNIKDKQIFNNQIKHEENKIFVKENINIEKLFIENIIKNNMIKNIISKNEEIKEIKDESKKNLAEKNKLINEKIEKLKCLKEKKEQILNQKAVKFDESIFYSNHKPLRKNTNLTEIDPSESILNENVLVKIPTSNICEVNKPTNENNNFKLYTEEDDTFQGDSQIILHFEDFHNILDNKESNKEYENEFLEENQIEKTVNDTIIETGNSFIRSHRRSRSQVIQKQLYSYAVKPQ